MPHCVYLVSVYVMYFVHTVYLKASWILYAYVYLKQVCEHMISTVVSFLAI